MRFGSKHPVHNRTDLGNPVSHLSTWGLHSAEMCRVHLQTFAEFGVRLCRFITYDWRLKKCVIHVDKKNWKCSIVQRLWSREFNIPASSPPQVLLQAKVWDHEGSKTAARAPIVLQDLIARCCKS